MEGSSHDILVVAGFTTPSRVRARAAATDVYRSRSKPCLRKRAEAHRMTQATHAGLVPRVSGLTQSSSSRDLTSGHSRLPRGFDTQGGEEGGRGEVARRDIVTRLGVRVGGF